MIEYILYQFHHSSINDLFNYFQQSPSLALMANQTDQLVKLINLVSTKLMCQTENLLSLHIHSISPSLYYVSLLLLIQVESSILLLPLCYYTLSLFVWSFIATCWTFFHFFLWSVIDQFLKNLPLWHNAKDVASWIFLV